VTQPFRIYVSGTPGSSVRVVTSWLRTDFHSRRAQQIVLLLSASTLALRHIQPRVCS